MGGLLKLILFCFCIYLLLKWLFKPVIQYFLKKAVNDFVKKNGGQFEARYQQQSGRRSEQREGSINVDYVPPKKNDSKIPDNEGEYVDYVEIK